MDAQRFVRRRRGLRARRGGAEREGDLIKCASCPRRFHEDCCEELRDAEKINEDYRLWLTTMPTPQFPTTVLQSSLKLTQEPPKGLKSNVVRAYIDLDVADFEGCQVPEEDLRDCGRSQKNKKQQSTIDDDDE